MGIPFLSLPGLVSHSSSSRAQLCVSEKSICCSGTQCSLKARTAQAWDGASGISDGSGGISLWADRLQTPVWQAVCTLSCRDSTVTFPATLFEKEFPNCWLLMGEGFYFLLLTDLEDYWCIWMQLHIQRTTTALRIPGISGFSFLHRQIWAHPIHKELAVHKLRIVQVQDKGRRVTDRSARARTMSAVRWGHWQNSTVRESAESWESSVPDWAYKTPLGINLLTQLCPACSMAGPAPHTPGSWISQVVPTTWEWKQVRLAWRQWED